MSAFLKTVVEAKDLHEIEDFVNRAVGPSGSDAIYPFQHRRHHP